MSLCPKCGVEVGDSPRFCDECRGQLFRSGRARALKAIVSVVILAAILLSILGYVLFSSGGANKTDNETLPQTATSPTPVTEGQNAAPVVETRQGQPTSESKALLRSAGVVRTVDSVTARYYAASNEIQLTLRNRGDSGLMTDIGRLALVLENGEMSSCDAAAIVNLRVEDLLAVGSDPLFERKADIDDTLREYSCTISSTGSSTGSSLEAGTTLNLNIHLVSPDQSNELRLEVTTAITRYTQQVESYVTAEDLWQLALWNARTGRLEVGFFAEQPTVESILELREKAQLQGVGEVQPRLLVVFDMQNQVNDFRRSTIKTFQLHLPRWAADTAERTGEEIFSDSLISDSRASLILKDVQLRSGALIQFRLEDARQRATAETLVTYRWRVHASAPLLLVDDTQAPTSFLRRLSREQSAVPAQTKGIVQTSRSTVEIVDALALSYPSEQHSIIGLYSRTLSEADKQKIIASKSVWAAGKELQPQVSILLSTQASGSNTVRLEVTVVRDYFGELLFDGSRDRQIFSFTDNDLFPSNLRFGSGGEGILNFRIRDSRSVTRGSEQFFWDLAVHTPMVEVR